MAEPGILPSIFYGALLRFLFGAIGALWFRMGTVLNRLGRVESASEATQKSVAEKTEAIETSLNGRVDNLQASVDVLVKGQHEMQLQMQRNHYQLMMAVLSHSHRSDGRPVFDLPPDIEPPANE